MSKVIKIKRGLDIRLKGAADRVIKDAPRPDFFMVKPPDFKGIDPKVLVKPGQEVNGGTPLFCDKTHPEIVVVSPVRGTIEAVNRGERRKLLEIVVRGGSNEGYELLTKADPSTLEPGLIREQIMKAGLWPALIQRPYGVVANPGITPRDIFISGFDTSPLAPDYGFILGGDADGFSKGVAALQKLTSGKVHISLRPGDESSGVFSNLPGVEYHYFSGPHPAGNAGVQIHHIAPLNKGEVVWTATPQLVSRIGKTFIKGHIDNSWVVALTGSYIRNPGYYRTIMGASVQGLLNGNLTDRDLPPRIISGNVLTGMQIQSEQAIGFYDSQVTVIPEGNYYDLFGWAVPGIKKYSMSRAFLSALVPRKEWDLDTNVKGGHRAFVVTGQYEKVLPMDIYPVYLLKAILAEDIDRMEQLGIYEVIEEDFALCEFACASKINVQEILRTGLDLLRKEMS